MKRKQAFELAEKLNPPMYPPKPRPYAVFQEGKEYIVIHLPTRKKITGSEG